MPIEDEMPDSNDVAHRLLSKAAELRAWKETNAQRLSPGLTSEKTFKAELEAISARPEIEALRTFLKEKPIGVNCGVWLHRRETHYRIGLPARYYRLGFRFLLFTSKGFAVAEKTYDTTTPLHEPWETHFQEFILGAEVPSPRYPIFRGLTDTNCRRVVQAGLTVDQAQQALEAYINRVLGETILLPE